MNIDISNAYCGLGLFPGPRLSEGRNVNQSSSRLPTRNSSARLGVSRSRRSSVTARFYDQVPRITDRLAVVSSLQSPPCGPFLAGGGARGMSAQSWKSLMPVIIPLREGVRSVLGSLVAGPCTLNISSVTGHLCLPIVCYQFWSNDDGSRSCSSVRAPCKSASVAPVRKYGQQTNQRCCPSRRYPLQLDGSIRRLSIIDRSSVRASLRVESDRLRPE